MTCKHGYLWCGGWQQWHKGLTRPCPECCQEMHVAASSQSFIFHKKLIELLEKKQSEIILVEGCQEIADGFGQALKIVREFNNLTT